MTIELVTSDTPSPNWPPTVGLVLAGGLARRMGGGDKALIRIGNATILERALARLAPQCATLLLNANGDPGRFASFGLPVAVVTSTICCRMAP